MISLHDLHKQGGQVEAAVMAFGALHSRTGAAIAAEPDWEHAEQHWRELVTFVLKRATPTSKSIPILQWAENAVTDVLLSFHTVPGCRTHSPPAPPS
ncbi:hypothetical protein AB0442_40540 [Kitasatospora sp. NPDC085895]|uniref:hypothetical protein n=1 Tax=Kitasatospora sp. NPDC085895 TaxID=3155057 RepID=UPI00344EE5F2